jgi:hypothetical protein
MTEVDQVPGDQHQDSRHRRDRQIGNQPVSGSILIESQVKTKACATTKMVNWEVLADG